MGRLHESILGCSSSIIQAYQRGPRFPEGGNWEGVTAHPGLCRYVGLLASDRCGNFAQIKTSGKNPGIYGRNRTPSFTSREPNKNNPHEFHPGTHEDLDSLFEINYCFDQHLYPSSTTTSKAMSPIYTQ